MTQTSPLYEELLAHLKETALLGSCVSVLGWDEQTYLPTGGAEHRANQLSLLSGMSHEKATMPRIGELLDEIEQENQLGPEDGPMVVNVREARRKYDRATKLPRRLVEEISHTTTMAQHSWVEARREKNFSAFQPWLEKVIALKREEAEAIGYGEGIPYDALLDDYEPGMTSAEVTTVFSSLRSELVELLAAIKNSGKEPDISILTRHYPMEAQRAFGTEAAAAIGFNFENGRLDVLHIPFAVVSDRAIAA